MRWLYVDIGLLVILHVSGILFCALYENKVLEDRKFGPLFSLALLFITASAALVVRIVYLLITQVPYGSR